MVRFDDLLIWHSVLYFLREPRIHSPDAGLQEQALRAIREKAGISDPELWKSAQLANEGLIDADLGGGVIKQRIARDREGKSGGSRAIILFRRNDRAVYVYGFEKKDLGNIKSYELEAFRDLAEVILGYSAAELEQRVRDGVLLKVSQLAR